MAEKRFPSESVSGFRRDSAPAEMVPLTYAVRFGQRIGYSTAPADSLRLVGAGSIRIDDDNVIISGKRKRPFRSGLDQTHAFKRDSILNVARSGTSIRLALIAMGSASQFVRFEAASVEEAEAIEGHLPDARTPEFAKEHAERSDFQARLDRFSPKAPVTPVLVAINVAAFVAMCVAGVGVLQPDGEAVVRWGSNFGPLTMDGQWWRLFTSMFLHFGLVHLALNMWALFDSGRMIERLYGSARFLMLYVSAGLAGSMASLLWNPQVNSAGASGAIFGIFGGLLAFVVNPRNGVPVSIMKEQRNSTMIFAAYSLMYGFAHNGIDNAAHIGGLLGGFAMGLLLARPLDAAVRSRSNKRDVAALAGSVVMLGLLLWPLMHPSAKVRDGQQFQLALVAFGSQESAAIEATNQLAERAKAGTISPPEYMATMGSDVLPKWDLLYRGISAAKLEPGHDRYSLQQALMRYVDGRRKSLQLFAQAVIANDSGLMEKAQAATAEAEAALAQVQAINKAND